MTATCSLPTFLVTSPPSAFSGYRDWLRGLFASFHEVEVAPGVIRWDGPHGETAVLVQAALESSVVVQPDFDDFVSDLAYKATVETLAPDGRRIAEYYDRKGNRWGIAEPGSEPLESLSFPSAEAGCQ